MLLDVISKQTLSLEILNLNDNNFSSIGFEEFLTKIAECGVCSPLKELNLLRSANFDSDETVSKFAEILAVTPVLKKCNIRD